MIKKVMTCWSLINKQKKVAQRKRERQTKKERKSHIRIFQEKKNPQERKDRKITINKRKKDQ